MFCMFYVKSFETHVSAEVGRRPALRRSRATPMRAPGQCGPSRSPNRFPSGPCGSWEAPRQLARGVGTASGGPCSPCRRLPHPLLCPCASRPPRAVSRHWAPGTWTWQGYTGDTSLKSNTDKNPCPQQSLQFSGDSDLNSAFQKVLLLWPWLGPHAEQTGWGVGAGVTILNMTAGQASLKREV